MFLKLWLIKKFLRKRKEGSDNWRIFILDEKRNFKDEVDCAIQKQLYNKNGVEIIYDSKTVFRVITYTKIDSKDVESLHQGLLEGFIFNFMLDGRLRYRVVQLKIGLMLKLKGGPETLKVGEKIRKVALWETRYFISPGQFMLNEWGQAGYNKPKFENIYKNIFEELAGRGFLKRIADGDLYAYVPSGVSALDDLKNPIKNRRVKLISSVVGAIVGSILTLVITLIFH